MKWRTSYGVVYWEQQRRAREKAYKKAVPRSGEPWTIAEDKRLLRARVRIRKLPKSARFEAWVKASRQLKRSMSALLTRLTALDAGRRLCKARA